eukprot:s7052_g2.t1
MRMWWICPWPSETFYPKPLVDRMHSQPLQALWLLRAPARRCGTYPIHCFYFAAEPVFMHVYVVPDKTSDTLALCYRALLSGHVFFELTLQPLADGHTHGCWLSLSDFVGYI